MSVLDRVRSDTGLTTTDRRHIREQTPSLEEISDPATLSDERSQSWRDWAAENSRLAIAGVFAGLLGCIVFVMLTLQYAPDAFATMWNRREILFGIGGLVVGTFFGLSKLKTRMLQWDQLTIKTSENNAKRYYGYYLSSDLGDYPLFVPVAGFTRFGLKANVYQISDISRQIVRKRGAPWQEDGPAIMRLDPAWTGVGRTDSGTVVTTVCDGFDVYDGEESNLKPITPEKGSKESLVKMGQQLEKAREEKDYQKQLATKYRRQRDNIMDEMDKPLDEVFADFLDHYQQIEEARSRDHRRRSEQSDNGVAPAKDVEREIEVGDDD